MVADCVFRDPTGCTMVRLREGGSMNGGAIILWQNKMMRRFGESGAIDPDLARPIGDGGQLWRGCGSMQLTDARVYGIGGGAIIKG